MPEYGRKNLERRTLSSRIRLESFREGIELRPLNTSAKSWVQATKVISRLPDLDEQPKHTSGQTQSLSVSIWLLARIYGHLNRSDSFHCIYICVYNHESQHEYTKELQQIFPLLYEIIERFEFIITAMKLTETVNE